MRKKMLKIICVMAMLLVLSSCSLIPISSLESMFNETGNSSITSGYSTGSAAKDSNVVIISKDEYEKYQKFSEMFTIYDTAKDYFYQEPDTDLMTEYAIRGLMAGLEDPYSFYYNPKEYKEMQEDDEEASYSITTGVRSNSLKDIISIESPMGKALLGRKAGEKIEVRVNDNYSYFVEIRKIEKGAGVSGDITI